MANGPGNERMYVVDAHALIFQVFYATMRGSSRDRVWSSPDGRPTNAVFGFARDLLYLQTEVKPEYLVCAFDVEGRTFRDTLFAGYKANRSPMPEDLRTQIPMIDQLLEAFRVPRLGVTGYEADDVIATVARAAEQRGLEVFICTSDKDCRQLIDERIRLFNLRKNEVFDRESLLKDWGITPEQAIDFQILVGDSVDSVPGVPGVGAKTASKLLQEFGSLDELLARVDQVKQAKLQSNLRAFADKAALSRRLVRLDDQVPLEMNWDAWRLPVWNTPRLLELFQEWGFQRFAEQVRALTPPEPPTTLRTPPAPSGPLWQGGVEERPPQQGELFPFGANEADASADQPQAPRPRQWQAAYHLVDTPEKFEAFLAKLRQQERFTIGVKTTHLDARRAPIVGWAFAWQEGEAWYLPVRGPAGDAVLDGQTVREALRPILENPRIAKTNQNIKYDVQVLRQQGIGLTGVAGDSMVADYLLHAGERSHNIEELAFRYINHQVIPRTDLIGKGKRQLGMEEVATSRVAEYAGEDADVAWRLCLLLEDRLSQEGLTKLYQDLEVPLIDVLAELEFTGVRIDVPLLERLSVEMTGQLAALEAEIHRLAGRTFNIASPRQLRQVLFDELRLPSQRKTGLTGEASTDQETLERLADLGHELPQKIIEHRQIAKLKGTYVDALPALVNPTTGRVHASFNQTVAATGRISSSDPNLQNIPVRTEQGKQIRQAFVPAEGWTLLAVDYSQIELRVLAHYSGDENLQRAFVEDRDIHSSVAAEIFSVPEPAVTSDMRRVAKTVNFGVIYGMSAFGLAQRLSIPKEEAARFIESYFGRYAKVLDYQTRLLEDCRKMGYVATLLGRRRQINGIRARSSYQQRNQPEREAINMQVQGSAADLIKLAMLRINRRLQAEKRQARMVLTVHDELVFEAPADEVQDVTHLVAEEMTNAMDLAVPLKVDVSVGPNWLDVEEFATAE